MDADVPAFPSSADPSSYTTTITTAAMYLPDHVVLVDREHRVTYMNPSGLAALGKVLSEVVGRPPEKLYPSTVAETLSYHYQQVLEYNKSVVCEFDFLNNEQEIRRYECVLAPVPGKNGHSEAILNTARDITHRFQIRGELSLRESELKYRTLFELMDEAFCLIEVLYSANGDANDYRFLEVNAAFEKHTNLQDAVGKCIRELDATCDEQLFVTYSNVVRTGEPARFEVSATPFGRYFDVHAFRVGTSEQNRVAILFNDISERKRVEESLARAYTKERRIAQMLQGSLLLSPPERFPGLSLVTRYHAAMDEAQVGGDFYDAFSLGNGKVALVVGDAAGKGLSAAAQIAEVKYALHIYLRETPDDPADALKRLNRYIYRSKQISGIDEMTTGFVALSLAVVEPRRGQGIFVTAGMDSPVLLRPEKAIMANGDHFGIALGIVEEVEYTATTCALTVGDLILLASDGITEARTKMLASDGSRTTVLLEMTGAARLLRENVSLEPEALMGDIPALRRLSERVLVGAREYGGGVFADDACLLISCVTD